MNPNKFYHRKSLAFQKEEEVFLEIDGVTVAMKKEEYDIITDPLFLYLEENYPIRKHN